MTLREYNYGIGLDIVCPANQLTEELQPGIAKIDPSMQCSQELLY